jgi:hypothetical protein
MSLPEPRPDPGQSVYVEGVVWDGTPYLRFALMGGSGVTFGYMPADLAPQISDAVVKAGQDAYEKRDGIVAVQQKLIIPNGKGPA